MSFDEKPNTPDRPSRILVVDDNADNCMILSLLLQRKGHTVRTTGCGATAVSVASEWHPHTVLLDIGLPGLDGYEVARRLRTDRANDPPGTPKMRVIAMTGQTATDEQVRKESAAGFDAHLLKPYDFDELDAMIAEGK